ncbi:MAG: hypothetical protein DLM50_09915 [Candidatus Meridianibacter frigidus]|nr:MAG: hypothetical protein DLM50_09915 [Candidatus Eremiobacteraeota bacterium]
MFKPLVALLLFFAAALSHCGDQTNGPKPGATPCSAPTAPFARALVSPANGETGVSPAVGIIKLKLTNIPAGAMALVRTIDPVTLSSPDATLLHSSVLQFSGDATYTGTLPHLAAATAYVVTSTDSSSAPPVIVGCFHTA